MVLSQKGVCSLNPNHEKMTGLITTTVIPVRLNTIKMIMTWKRFFKPHFFFNRSRNEWLSSASFTTIIGYKHAIIHGICEIFNNRHVFFIEYPESGLIGNGRPIVLKN